MFLVAFRGVVIGAFVWQLMSGKVGFEFGLGPVEDGVHLQSLEFFVPLHRLQGRSALRVLLTAEGGEPDGRGEFLHAALKGLELHDAAEIFHSGDFIWHGQNAAVESFPMLCGHLGEVRKNGQVELFDGSVSKAIGLGQVRPVIHPEDINAGLHAGGEVQDDGLIGAEIGGDDSAPQSECENRLNDFGGGLA